LLSTLSTGVGGRFLIPYLKSSSGMKIGTDVFPLRIAILALFCSLNFANICEMSLRRKSYLRVREVVLRAHLVELHEIGGLLAALGLIVKLP
jgi:hypothetical protein